MNLGKPPENISAEALFTKICTRLDENLRAIPDGQKRIGKPLFNPKKPLNDEQWHSIAQIQAALEEEYNLRRKVLVTRLDVTIQSFKWSDKIKGKEKDINERYSNRNQVLEKLQFGGQRTDVASLLSARDKLAIIEKTSSANVRKNTHSKLQRHIIGKVPDRGGRALDQQRPPQEMPSWQKRKYTLTIALIKFELYHKLFQDPITREVVEVDEVVMDTEEADSTRTGEIFSRTTNNSKAFHHSSFSKKLPTTPLISKAIPETIKAVKAVKAVKAREEDHVFKVVGIREIKATTISEGVEDAIEVFSSVAQRS